MGQPGPLSSPTWRTFLRNHMPDIAAIDMFVVVTATFRLLYALIVLSLDRRRVVHCNALGMIVDEDLPGLQRPIPPGHHVDRNRGLGDPKAELEQLAMHPGGAPQRVLQAHSADQVAHFLGD